MTSIEKTLSVNDESKMSNILPVFGLENFYNNGKQCATGRHSDVPEFKHKNVGPIRTKIRQRFWHDINLITFNTI